MAQFLDLELQLINFDCLLCIDDVFTLMLVIGSFEILQKLLLTFPTFLLVIFEGLLALQIGSLSDKLNTSKECLYLMSFSFSSYHFLPLLAIPSASVIISSSCFLINLF